MPRVRTQSNARAPTEYESESGRSEVRNAGHKSQGAMTMVVGGYGVLSLRVSKEVLISKYINPLNTEWNPICQ